MRGVANEGLILFKPHFSASCPTHQMKRLSAAARRFYFDCPCPIWIQGRMVNGERVPRQTTGVNTLREAEALRDSWTMERATASASSASHGPMISECIDKYTASRAGELASKTQYQTTHLLKQLRQFCEQRNVIHMRGLTVDLLETFKTEGLSHLASTSKGTAVAKLRCFLRHAYRREWIKESLVDKVSTHKAVYDEKQPYNDKEVELILAEAGKLNGGRHGYASHPETFRVLLELMLATGMRVSDAVNFDPTSLSKGKVFWIYTYYPQKQKRVERPRVAEAYISADMKAAIDGCAWLSPGKPFFYAGTTSDPTYVIKEVYSRMQTIGSRCGVADCRPHRLRDTFAVRRLLAGMQLQDVSRLLNHSSIRITETYYARWVTSRKLRLESLLAESFVNA